MFWFENCYGCSRGFGISRLQHFVKYTIKYGRPGYRVPKDFNILNGENVMKRWNAL